MVLKNSLNRFRFLILLILFPFLSQLLFAADVEQNYWQELVNTAFKNNPEVVKIQSDYNSARIYKMQNDYSWFPVLQIDLPQNVNESRSDYLYIRNGTTSSENGFILNPNIRLAIYQKLPGNGSLSLTTGYGFYYLLNRRVFLQYPQINLNLEQTLAKGAFGLTKNPQTLLLNEQMEYAELNYKVQLFDQLQKIFNLISDYDNQQASILYYEAQYNQYESAYSTARNKNVQGMQSNLESYYAEHQLNVTKSDLAKTRLQFRKSQKEATLLHLDLSDIDNQRNILFNLLNKFKTEKKNDTTDNSLTLERRLYENMLKQNLYSFQKEKLNYRPVFYINVSSSPNSDLYYYYSDFYRSLRDLVSSPYPVNINTSVGIKYNFELPKAAKLRKELYKIENQNIDSQLQTYIQRQKKEIVLNNSEMENLKEYITVLQSELENEQNFRTARKELYKKGLLTQNDYYESEVLYFNIYRDYIYNLWLYIEKNIENMKLSSECEDFLDFMLSEENYD